MYENKPNRHNELQYHRNQNDVLPVIHFVQNTNI